MEILTGNLSINLFVIATTLLITLAVYFKRCFTFWKRRDVYTLPPSIPFGNAANLFLQKVFVGSEFKNIYEAFKQKNLKYGGYYMFGKPIFIPIDLDLVKQIMVKDFDYFTDHSIHVDSERQPLTAHLFALKGESWRKLRQTLNPTFTSGKIKMMFQTILDCSKELLPEIDRIMKEDQCIDTKDLVGRLTIDVIGSCAFGIECNSLRNPKAEFALYCQKTLKPTLRNSLVNFLMFFCPEILYYANIRSFPTDIEDFFMNIVKTNVNYREKHNISRNDFMNLLIQLKNKTDTTENGLEELTDTVKNKQFTVSSEESLTVEEITAQCFLIFMAGFETTATTLTFCLFELAENPELQKKVRDEIKTVLNKHGHKITYDALMEMSFMEMCINETLRKHPPLSIHTRACTKRYNVPNSNVTLEEGAFVFISTLGIHTDPEIYPDPEKFDPERFSGENRASRHPSAWIPFGDGPRMCLGLRFATVAMKIGLTVLLQNYRFVPNSKTKIPIVMDPRNPLTQSVMGGIWLDAEKLAQ